MGKGTKNPIQELQRISTDLWNEMKALNYSRMKGEKKRCVKRMENLIGELEGLIPNLKQEMEVFKGLHQLNT